MSDQNPQDHKAMSDEKRMEMARKLAELKEKKAREGQQSKESQQQVQQPHLGYAYAGHATEAYGGQDGYGGECGDYGGEQEGYDDQEEQFLDFVEDFIMPGGQQQQQSAQSLRYTRLSEEDMADTDIQVVHTTMEKTRHVLDEFEALRCAKMGDTENMNAVAYATGASLAKLVDNKGRNAMHYAADSGSKFTLGVLAAANVPAIEDENGMTPMDVAVLAGHDEEILTLIGHICSSLKPSPVEDLFNKFAIKPPGFVVGKPAPAPPQTTRARAFWGVAASSSSASSVNEKAEKEGITIYCAGEGKHSLATDASTASIERTALLQSLPSMCDGVASGFSSWLKPLEADTVIAHAPRLTVVVATSTGAEEKERGDVAGVVAALSLGGHLKGGNPVLKNLKPGKVSVAGCLAVKFAYRGKGVVAPALMQSLSTQLSGSGAETVFFATPALLPRPPTAVAMVKWFRRVLAAPQVLASSYAHSAIPEFLEYTEVLRADVALKGTAPASLKAKYAEALEPWVCIDRDNTVHVGWVLDFLQNVPGAEAGVELQYVPNSVEDLMCGILATGLKVYARRGEDKLTDLVVFRVRELHESSRSDDSAVLVVVAQVVFSIFVSIKSTEKAQHLLLIANEFLHAQLLYVPTMGGFTDSDLAKANFDEVTGNRQFLYACTPGKPEAPSPIAPMPGAKVAVPVFLL